MTQSHKDTNPKIDIDPYELIPGFILSIIGGISSILLGVYIFSVYPEMGSVVTGFMVILQSLMIYGGIITLIGAFLLLFKPSFGVYVVLIGTIISGVNLISVCGVLTIFKKIKQNRMSMKAETYFKNSIERKKEIPLKETSTRPKLFPSISDLRRDLKASNASNNQGGADKELEPK